LRIHAAMLRSVLALSALACVGCSNAPPTGAPFDSGVPDSGTSFDASADPLDLCPNGTLRHFSLAPIDPLPSASEIAISGLAPDVDVVAAGTGLAHSVRLDVCEEEGAPALKAIFVREEVATIVFRPDDAVAEEVYDSVELAGGYVSQLRVPASAFVVEGLEEALQGNLQPFRVTIASSYDGLRIVGHAQFLAMARREELVVVGDLREGDVFLDMKCRFHEALFTRTFTLATATFDVEACTFGGGGRTTGYEFLSIAVRDSSPELTEAERQRFVLATRAELDAALTYAWHHHNACDSFHLALPHADYAAAAGNTIGCGPTVPNAPIPGETDNDVLFRIRYHGEDWSEGSLPGCHHYLFCQ
jgi:hypothetical protein